MKNMLKRTLAVFIAVIMTFGSAPLSGLVGLELPDWLDFSKLFEVKAEATSYSGTCGDNLTWTLDTDTGVLKIGGTGAMTDYTSSSISPWYSYRSDIKTAKIGDSVTSIGYRAFTYCDSLTSVTIGDSVTSIGDYAFNHCDSLTSIEIPDSVTCIGDSALYSCDSLTSVTIGDSVTNIGYRAFEDCTNLSSIEIPDSVTSIGDSAFYSCDSLTSVTIGDSATSIGEDAFAYCDSLTNITVDSANTAYSNDEYGVLFNNDKTVLIQYPIGNTRTSYTIPDSVTNIGYRAFTCCDSLTSVTIGDSVTGIGEDAFEDCDNLASIEIPDSVTSIGDSAFEDCDSLTSVTIGDSVTSIGYRAFYSCDSLTSVTIGDSVTSIGYRAFEDCTNLTSIEIPDSVTSIGTYAFWGCDSLTSVIIGDSVISIGTYAFQLCDSLTSVTIGDSVTSIGDCAFRYCDSLTDVFYGGSEEDWSAISIGNNNECLTYATIHYNYVVSDDKFHTVSWVVDGDVIKTQNFEYGSAVVAPADPTKEGYSFVGWVEPEGNIVTFPFMMTNENITFTALFEASTNAIIKLGSDRFSFGENISGFEGESANGLIVYTSADYDTTSLTVKSSNTNVVSIGSITHDSGDYICGENEHRAAVQLNFKSKGTATVTVTSPEGISECITVTVEEKDKTIAVFSTSKSFTVETGESLWLGFGIATDGVLEEDWKNMAITVSDSTVVALSEYKNTEYGYSLEIIGKKEGLTNLTITDTETGLTTAIVVKVFDEYTESYSYDINDMAYFYPNNGWESTIKTNIYDMNGLYINNYSCTKSGDKYYVSFDSYNQRYHHGAVDIYDAEGNWLGSEQIEKSSDISSLYDTGEQIYYMVTDGDWLTYQHAMQSKKTSVNFEVPDGGYFTISNNFAESPGCFLYNAGEIFYEGVSAAIDVATGNVETPFVDLIVGEIQDNKATRELFYEIFINAADKEIREYSKNILSGNIDSSYAGISGLLENMLHSLDIEWEHLFRTAAGIGESVFEKLAGPAGLALQGCFGLAEASNKYLQAVHIADSIDKAYACVYTDIDEGYINPHGVIVNTNGNIDAEAVLQVFRISNDSSVDVILDSDNPLEEHELYNICFVKNDKLVQPNGKVKVYVPIPAGMDSNTCVIYRQESNGSWTILNAKIEENYLVFETDHFSLYAVIGNRGELTVSSLPDKITYIRNDVLDTTGLVLKLNGETITEGFFCDPTVMYEYGIQKITVKYGEAIAEFEVNVLEPSEIATNISVYKNPNKTIYYVGDSLDTTGLQIKVTYSDSSTKVISSGFSVSSLNSSAAGTKTITVNYSGCKTTFSVTVKKPMLTLSKNSLSLTTGDTEKLTATTTPPSQTVEWSSSDTSVIKVSDGNVTAVNTGTAVITASFTYNGISYTSDCYVTNLEPEVVLESISIHSPLVKTEYFIGDELDICGLSLELLYSNDTVSVITEGFVVTGFDPTTAGTQTLTVSYGGKTVSFDVTVENVAISSIAVETMPTNTSYYVGDTLDTSGLALTAKYNNGATETVSSGFACSPTTLNTTGTQKITVTYNGKTTSFNVTVDSVELSRLQVKTYPKKTIYYVGEELDTTGLTLTATYSNNSTKIISSGFTASGFSSSSAGTKTVKVSYNGTITSFKVTVVSIDSCGDNAYWTFDESTCTLTITGSGAMYNWTSSYYAPWHELRSSIKNVIIENGITSIGSDAFKNCNQLTAMVIPNSVTRIENYAFYGCKSIKELTIPVSAKIYNSEYTFYNCSYIDKITLSKGTGMMQTYGTSTLSSSDTTCYKYTPWYISGCSEIIIEEGVLSIGDYAFYDFNWSTKMIIEEDVASIGEYAFYGCNWLESVYYTGDIASWCAINFESCNSNPLCYTDNLYINGILLSGELIIPDNVTSIGNYSFAGCDQLTKVIISDSVTNIGNYAFYGCSGLKELTMPVSVKFYNSFGGCTNIETITLTKGTGMMRTYSAKISGSSEYYPYYGYTPWYISGCSEIIIEDGVTNIGEYAFCDCTELKTVTIPDSVTEIHYRAFDNCSKTLKIYYNGTLEEWSEITSDSYNTDLTENVLFESRSERPYYAGTGSDNFVWKLYTDGELVIYGTGDMKNYSNSSHAPWYSKRSTITSATLSEGITSVGNYAFVDLNKLTNVRIPNSVTNIGNYAFYGCSGIKELTMPASAKIYNSEYTFYNCKNIEKVTLTKGTGTMQSYGLYESNSSTYTYYSYTPWYISGCSEIIIEDGVTNIDKYAFYDCDDIIKVTISSSVTNIGGYAFDYCFNLTDVYYTGDIADWCAINFDYYYSNPMYYANNLYIDGVLVSGELVIPDGIASIGDYTFYNCENITSVTIPESVANIGDYAFTWCSGLVDVYYMGDIVDWCKINFDSSPMYYADNLYINGVLLSGELVIPDGVTSIGDRTFVGCDKLTSVTIPDSVTAIGSSAFSGCTGIKELTMPASAKIYNSEYTFYDCTNIEKVTLTKGAGTMQTYGTSTSSSSDTTYYKYTPWYISNCSEIIIEDGVSNIGNYAFCDCTGIKELTMPASAKISSSTFSNCTNIEKITLTKGTGTMQTYSSEGEYTPWYISGCSEIIIEDGVSNISDYAFNGCAEITSITIPDSVTSIGKCAFDGCSNLISITIPDSVTTIGKAAFEDCTGLVDVYYTGDIADWCAINFDYYSNPMCYANNLYIDGVLVSGELVIPETVTSIGSFAFYSCNELTSIIIPDSVTSIGDYAFANCEGLVKANMGTGVINIGFNSFFKCTNLTSVIIHKNVASIGSGAFDKCTGLTSVYYIGTQSEWNKISIDLRNSALTSKVIFDANFDDIPDVPGAPSYSLKLDIRTPSTTTISYGDKIILHADLNGTLPTEWSIRWTSDNSNFSYTTSSDSKTCTISPSSSGSTTFTATVCDAEGNVVSEDKQVMTSKAGFFDKIVAFFKKLFGMTKVIVQSLYII